MPIITWYSAQCCTRPLTDVVFAVFIRISTFIVVVYSVFEKGIDKILKKVGEECTEVIIAGKADDKAETVYELADLAYHAMVLMVQMGISVEDVHRELASRHIIDHKVKQEKMTK